MPQQQSKTRDTIRKLIRANHLGTNGREVMTRVHKHKQINTKEDQVLYSLSAVAESNVDPMRLCGTVRESVEKGLDHTPLGERTEQRLQDRTDRMYCATELV